MVIHKCWLLLRYAAVKCFMTRWLWKVLDLWSDLNSMCTKYTVSYQISSLQLVSNWLEKWGNLGNKWRTKPTRSCLHCGFPSCCIKENWISYNWVFAYCWILEPGLCAMVIPDLWSFAPPVSAGKPGSRRPHRTSSISPTLKGTTPRLLPFTSTGMSTWVGLAAVACHTLSCAHPAVSVWKHQFPLKSFYDVGLRARSARPLSYSRVTALHIFVQHWANEPLFYNCHRPLKLQHFSALTANPETPVSL